MPKDPEGTGAPQEETPEKIRQDGVNIADKASKNAEGSDNLRDGRRKPPPGQ